MNFNFLNEYRSIAVVGVSNKLDSPSNEVARYLINNGFTVFDGKRKIRSKKNRAIMFDGSTKHHSTTPTDSNWRCSINIDYMS